MGVEGCPEGGEADLGSLRSDEVELAKLKSCANIVNDVMAHALFCYFFFFLGN